jgi:hypothetical protein
MNEETDQELPEVNGVHIIKVNNDGSEDIKSFMEDWLEENADISTDPCEIVIFSPYDMEYILDRDKENNQCLQLTGFMQREKWATLQDADDLRKFAFHLEKNHKNLKVKVALALSIKEAEETDEDYNFTQAFFTKNEEMRDMLIQMHEESEAEDDEKLFGGDDE